jgi:hypothetical protein
MGNKQTRTLIAEDDEDECEIGLMGEAGPHKYEVVARADPDSTVISGVPEARHYGIAEHTTDTFSTVQTSRPMNTSFYVVSVALLFFAVCVIVLSRAYTDSSLLFINSVVSVLVLTTLVAAVVALCSSSYISPIKFELLVVTIAQVVSLVFSSTIFVAAYHDPGITYGILAMSAPSRTQALILLLAISYSVFMVAQIVLYRCMSLVLAENQARVIRQKLDEIEQREQRRLEELRERERENEAKLVSQRPHYMVRPAVPYSPHEYASTVPSYGFAPNE